MLVRGARRTLGVAGILLTGASIWLGVMNMRSGVALVALGLNAVACGLLAYWGLAGPRFADADSERTIIALAAARGAPLSEAEIVLETDLSLAQVRAILDRMRKQGVAEIIFRDGDTLAYQVIGLQPKTPLRDRQNLKS
jgi:hypothetical protein